MDYSRFYDKFDEFKQTGKTEIEDHKICMSDHGFKKCDIKNLSKIKWDNLGIKEALDLKKSLEKNGSYSHKKSGINLCHTDDFSVCSPALVEKFTDLNKNKIRNTAIVLTVLILIIIFIISR